MKKVLLLLFLFLPLLALANEEDLGVVEPQWKEFVPPAFADVTEPKGIGKLNESATYWYKRRVAFEEAIEKCKQLEKQEDIYSCYQEVKVKQYQENSEYNAKIEALERARLGPQEMYNRTDTMYPIGGYLNTFTRFQPNELR